MKKCILLLSIVLAICCLFTSCDDTSICTVTFKGIDGVAEQAVPKGRKATQPALSTQQENSNPGFAFVGWTLDGDDYDFTAPVTKDLILVANWGSQCTVSFNTGKGGTEMEPQKIIYYTKLEKPKDPTRRGYTFKHWTTEELGGGDMAYDFDKAQPVYESFELIAVWEPKSINVQYVATTEAGESVIKEATVECGETITIEDFPSSQEGLQQAGWALTGWTFNGETYHVGDVVTVEANATGSETVMTLTAEWKKSYNVGEIGPSGGLIICKADTIQTTKYTDESGNEVEFKWQYIEAAPSPMSKIYCFGYKVQSGTAETIGAFGTSIGTGLSNTKALVKALGAVASLKADGSAVEYTYINEVGEEQTTSETEGLYAAKACDDYVITNSSNMTYDDWILPSEEEFSRLYVVYRSFSAGRSKFVTGNYVTSTEVDETQCRSTVVQVTEPIPSIIAFDSQTHTDVRSYLYNVWPVRYF